MFFHNADFEYFGFKTRKNVKNYKRLSSINVQCTGRQTVRQTDKQTGIQTDGQYDMEAGRQIHKRPFSIILLASPTKLQLERFIATRKQILLERQLQMHSSKSLLSLHNSKLSKLFLNFVVSHCHFIKVKSPADLHDSARRPILRNLNHGFHLPGAGASSTCMV